MFQFLNQFTGKKWWYLVQIAGILMVIMSFFSVLPLFDICWDSRHSFGAGQIIGDVFDDNNPLRIVVFGRWVVSDQNSPWIIIVGFFILTFCVRIGELMISLGHNYRRGLVFHPFKRWNPIVAGQWVDPSNQG